MSSDENDDDRTRPPASPTGDEARGLEIPVKVVDRRWWARETTPADEAEPGSLKPTYVEELERQVAEKDRLIQGYLEKHRQAATEFEETRTRMRREIAKEVERGRRAILVELLDVVDNLDRAVEASRRSENLDALLQGVEMVRRQFLSTLEGLNVTRIESLGDVFDPERHEAVATVQTDDPAMDGTIVGVITHGYAIGSEVLRPAVVAVAKLSEP
ncbi:MAG: nucleotide exchange factor GrpE [Acidobacteria bacterium]|nr:nucleotide exchange factor GrpE [Acidobacteriota bacterium]